MKFTVIRQKAVLDASPEEVYEAYVNPKKHAEFTGSAATGLQGRGQIHGLGRLHFREIRGTGEGQEDNPRMDDHRLA